MSTGTGDTLERDAAILADAYSAEELRAGLDLWKKAEAGVASAQSYQLAGRALTRADAPEIRRNILTYARAARLAETASLPRSRFVTARFTGGLADHG
jgi:hypothetical protein